MASNATDLAQGVEHLSLSPNKESYREQLFKSVTEYPFGFDPLLSSLERTTEEVHLDDFIGRCLSLKLRGGTQQSLLIEDDHSYFTEVQRFCNRWNLPEQNLHNFKTLLRGNLLFPVLLLSNPPDSHDEEYDQMLEGSPTLYWLRWFFTEIGLSMEDIVIIDMFPFLSDKNLESIERAERPRAMAEAFDLTLEFLDTFKPDAVMSCQCKTQSELSQFWSSFDDPIARKLCSTVDRAERLIVQRAMIHSHEIHLVQGFDPSYFLKEEDLLLSEQSEDTLCCVLRKTYAPCSMWKMRSLKDLTRKRLVEANDRVKEGLADFVGMLRPYREALVEAESFGVSLDEVKLAEDLDVEFLVLQLLELL